MIRLAPTILLATLLAACGSPAEPGPVQPPPAEAAATIPPPPAPAAVTEPAAAPAEAVPNGVPRRIDIAVTPQGFEPNSVPVRKNEPVELVFTRKTDATCAKAVIVHLPGGAKVQKDLPLDTPVAVAATWPEAGEMAFGCTMGMMIKGTVRVE